MALNLEFESGSRFVPHTDLQNPTDLLEKSVVKDLMKKGRVPILVAHDGQAQINPVVCFIPPDELNPSQTFNLKYEDAAKIAIIIRKELRRLT